MPPKLAELTPEIQSPTLTAAEHGGPAVAAIVESSRTVATTSNGTRVDLGANVGPASRFEVRESRLVTARLRLLGNSGLTLGDLDMGEMAEELGQEEWSPPVISYHA